MPVSAGVYAVFSYFENLNLLALLQDLRAGRTARQAWLSGEHLCPVAHGMPHGAEVRELKAIGQIADLPHGCRLAASYLGADFGDVLSFVRSWDEELLDSGSLLRQLEEIWQERISDAQAMQALLQEGSSQPQEIIPGHEERELSEIPAAAEPAAAEFFR